MTETGAVPPGEALPGVDRAGPSPARLHDDVLGGTTSFPVDRAAGDAPGGRSR
jgi:hypothetical protein